MILSYRDIFTDSKKRTRIKAEVTTEHSASSYGQPVIVLDDGGALDRMSWVALDYQIVRSSKKEREGLKKMGLL